MDPFKAVAATYENWFDTPLGRRIMKLCIGRSQPSGELM